MSSKQNTSFSISSQLSKALEKHILFFNAENYDELEEVGLLDKSSLYRVLLRRYLNGKLEVPVDEALMPAERAADEMYERLMFPEESAE